MEKIDQCNTTVTTQSVLEGGMWEKENHTLYHFNTICQEAVSKSLKLRQEPKDDVQEIHHFSFKNKEAKNRVALGEIQKKAKNIARLVIDSYYKNLAGSPSNHSENNQTHSTLPTSFWDNLTDTFTAFFTNIRIVVTQQVQMTCRLRVSYQNFSQSWQGHSQRNISQLSRYQKRRERSVRCLTFLRHLKATKFRHPRVAKQLKHRYWKKRKNISQPR